MIKSIFFQNLNKSKSGLTQIGEFVQTHKPFMFSFAEPPKESMNADLFEGYDKVPLNSGNDKRKLEVYCQKELIFKELTPCDDNRIRCFGLELKKNELLLLTFVHLQDVRNHNLFQKHGLTILTAEKIRTLEKKLSNESKTVNSVIMGDFNMPPTNNGMTDTLGFNSTGVKSKLKERTKYQFKTYTNYYNPSFVLLSDTQKEDSMILYLDENNQHQTTGYTFKSKNATTHLIDHVLMNKNFLGLNPFVTIFEKGLEYSDHALLLLQFEPFRFQ